jgi:hypothetical protein
VAGCLFAGGGILDEREGELHEIYTPAWAGGLHLRDAHGADRELLLERAGTDQEKLTQIREARGYKPGWVYYQALDAIRQRDGADD